jgi:hypothetical protein
MRIEGPRSNSGVGKSSKAGGAAGGFSLGSNAPAAASPSSGQASALTSMYGLDAILALQSVESGDDRRRRAVQHGHDLLDQLEALRADLLAGHVSPQRVGSLVTLIRGMQTSDDPRLAALIGDIALRARVELAKLGLDAA